MALGLCGAGPAGCLVGGGITLGQILFGASAAGTAAALWTGRNIFKNDTSNSPSLPDGLVGDNPRETKGRTNTDLPASKFPETVQDLTGGNISPDTTTGHLCCDNGVRIRPGDGSGPRIDIPANGSKPRETIHFPPSTSWPW